jgi:hypothetical protein
MLSDPASATTREAVDRVLRQLAAERNAHEHLVNRWLLRGFELGVEHLYGYASFHEYVMRVFDLGARGAEDRIRTARQLEALPLMTEACRRGRVLYAITRELTRVATPETEAEWLAASTGKTSREVQRMVSGLVRGDRPDAKKKPEAIVEDVVFRRVAPHARALLEQARVQHIRESGGPVDDAELLEAMARAFLASRDESAQDAGRAPYQISLVVCERCRSGEHTPANIVATEVDVAVACCDAQQLGRVDVPASELEAAHQIVPPKVRRAVAARHRHRCAIPGCSRRAHVDLHHVELRSRGGTHDPENLIALCTQHHRAAHEGKLIVRGRYSSGFTFEHADGASYASPPIPHALYQPPVVAPHARAVGSLPPTAPPPQARAATVFTQAKSALVSMGYRAREAERLLDRVRDRVDDTTRVEDALKAALRAAPIPAGVREELEEYRRAG